MEPLQLRQRLIIGVPVLTPRLSSLWLGLTTPVYARVGRKLIEGVRNATVVHDDSAQRDFAVRPMGLAEAISRALRNEDRRFAATRVTPMSHRCNPTTAPPSLSPCVSRS